MANKTKINLVIGALLLSMLACEINVGGPNPPDRVIPVSQGAIDALQNSWQVAFAEAAITGDIVLTITEEQLTSFLDQKLSGEEDPFIQDPQVYLDNGQIQIYGKANQGNLIATARIVLQLGIDPEGKPTFELSGADFGPVPVPDGLLKAVSTTLNEAFTGQFGPVATGVRVNGFQITDGVMVIVGKTR